MTGKVWASFGGRRCLLQRLLDIGRMCHVRIEVVSIDRGWITTSIEFEAFGTDSALRAFRAVFLRAMGGEA